MSVYLLNDLDAPYPQGTDQGLYREWDVNHDIALQNFLGLPAPPVPPLPGLRELITSIRRLVPKSANVYPDVEAAAKSQGVIPIFGNEGLPWSSRPNGGNVTPNKSGQYGIAV